MRRKCVRRTRLALPGLKHTANREDNVQAELAGAADFEEDTQRGEEDGEDDLADVTVHRGRVSLEFGRCSCCEWTLWVVRRRAVWHAALELGTRGL